LVSGLRQAPSQHLVDEDGNEDSRERLLSQMIYKVECHDATPPSVARQWIEPLVGFLRDPQAICAGFRTRQQLESKRYLVLGDQALVARSHPTSLPGVSQRVILLDIGCGYYAGSFTRDPLLSPATPQGLDDRSVSLQWLVERYQHQGVFFTDVFAFESSPLSAGRFWSAVPPSMVPRLRLYNFGVSATPGAMSNPWSLLQRVATPGDYVVVKLDIDSPTLERNLTRQLITDHKVRHMLGLQFERQRGWL